MALNILLIENSPDYARAFRRSLRELLPDPRAVAIHWSKSASEAMHYLQSAEADFLDQIWVEQTIVTKAELPKLLAMLEKIAPREVHQLFKGVPVGAGAEKFTSSYHYLAAIVGELMSKKSSGATARVENARLEGKIAANDYRIEQLEKSFGQLAEEARSCNRHLDERLDVIERTIAANSSNATAQIERMKGRQLILQAGISAVSAIVVGLGVAFLSNLDKVEKFLQFKK